MVRYVNLDNAATTPPLRAVVDAVERSCRWPPACTVAPDTSRGSARRRSRRPARSSGTSSGPTRSRRRDLHQEHHRSDQRVRPDDGVARGCGRADHRPRTPLQPAAVATRGPVVHVRAEPDGTLDEEDLDIQLARHAVGSLCRGDRRVERDGCRPADPPDRRQGPRRRRRILVDAAQLAGHRPIDMLRHDDPGHLEPWPCRRTRCTRRTAPVPSSAAATVLRRCRRCGGGTVSAVTLDEVVWADLPDRGEAGSPNLLGAIAFAAAARRLPGGGAGRNRRPREQLARYAASDFDGAGLTVSGRRVPGSA